MSTTEQPKFATEEKDIAADVYQRVEHSLHTRRAPKGTRRAKIEERLKRKAARVWSLMKERPSIGVITAGALGLALASVFGVGELAVAISAAYAAYEVLREGVPPADAVKKSIVLIEEVAE